jgi:enamine deaminase RidA (YjgF/YER057c/UK114 family)
MIMMNIYDRLKELGITLPPAPAPGGLYAPVRVVGKLAFVSGAGPAVINGRTFAGKVGAQVGLEEACEAARLCAVNLLSILEDQIGLDKVKSAAKILAFVQSAPGFNDQPQVINAASQLLNDVFPESGGHARAAIGAAELPGSLPVEIEGIFELY